MRKHGAIFLLVLLVFIPYAAASGRALTQAPAGRQVSGTVVDLTGSAVPSAQVSIDGSNVLTDDRGRFSIAVDRADVLLLVRAAGFAASSVTARAGESVRVILQPAGVAETLTVTAARSPGRIAHTASAVTAIGSGALLTTGASTLDDALRSVPGFSLFRRSSSRVANPTTQGVSLRGLAASGASRGLVLADGIPLNDPYGAWVYWDRIPQIAIDRVEVVRGSGAEALYGLNGIGGALQVLALRPRSGNARASVEGGQHGMWRASGYAGTRRGAWDGFLSAERYALDGFKIVAPDERGPVDVNAGLRYANALAMGGWTGPRWALTVRVNGLDEDRGNGTPLQRNDTNIRSGSISGRAEGLAGLFSFSAYAGDTNYDQSFSAIAADRASERLTATQRVMSEHQGGSLQWFGSWGARSLLLGGEAQRVAGGGSAANSGTQFDRAFYSQVALDLTSRLRLVMGARAGRWSTTPENSNGSRQERGYLVPRVAATWAQSPSLSFVASWSLPKRTPTLNELYRDFQVGNVSTEHNVRLVPEDAHTAEAGVLARRGPFSTRLVGFWTQLDGAITNVTVAVAADRILRQRRNAGTIRARGLEAEGEWRPVSWGTITGSAAWTRSSFLSSDEPGLAGKRVSQVPRWQTTISARYARGRTVASVDWRSVGVQFDDDRNLFALRRATVLDLYAGANLPRGIQPFIAAENLFDAGVDVGRTPVRTIGTPRSVRVGVRLWLWP